MSHHYYGNMRPNSRGYVMYNGNIDTIKTIHKHKHTYVQTESSAVIATSH